jgi:hypothetical protein
MNTRFVLFVALIALVLVASTDALRIQPKKLSENSLNNNNPGFGGAKTSTVRGPNIRGGARNTGNNINNIVEARSSGQGLTCAQVQASKPQGQTYDCPRFGDICCLPLETDPLYRKTANSAKIGQNLYGTWDKAMASQGGQLIFERNIFKFNPARSQEVQSFKKWVILPHKLMRLKSVIADAVKRLNDGNKVIEEKMANSEISILNESLNEPQIGGLTNGAKNGVGFVSGGKTASNVINANIARTTNSGMTCEQARLSKPSTQLTDCVEIGDTCCMPLATHPTYANTLRSLRIAAAAFTNWVKDAQDPGLMVFNHPAGRYTTFNPARAQEQQQIMTWTFLPHQTVRAKALFKEFGDRFVEGKRQIERVVGEL